MVTRSWTSPDKPDPEPRFSFRDLIQLLVTGREEPPRRPLPRRRHARGQRGPRRPRRRRGVRVGADVVAGRLRWLRHGRRRWSQACDRNRQKGLKSYGRWWFNGVLWKFCGILWDFMGFCGGFMVVFWDFYGIYPFGNFQHNYGKSQFCSLVNQLFWLGHVQ